MSPLLPVDLGRYSCFVELNSVETERLHLLTENLRLLTNIIDPALDLRRCQKEQDWHQAAPHSDRLSLFTDQD